MTIKEARAIVGKMVLWSMMAQGIEPKEQPGIITEDLQTLLQANRKVAAANKQSQNRINKIIAEKGVFKGSRKISMTIADRGIAALYVAANFPGDNPETADVLAMHRDRIVLCLNKRLCEKTEEDEL